MTSLKVSARRPFAHVAHKVRLFVVASVLLGLGADARAALVGYWRFSSTDPAGTALDSAGVAQNGTFFGGAQSSIVVDGSRGDVLNLNQGSPGTEGGSVQTTTIPSMANTSWVVWINARSGTNANGGYPMWMTSSGNYEFRFLGTTQRVEIINSGNIAQDPAAVSLNAWHQVAHVQNGAGANNFTLFVDGNAVATGTGTAWGGNKTIDFGQRQGGSYFFNGLLDEATVWSDALSLGKIRALRIPVLGYDALQLEQLFNVYDTMSTTPIVIDGRSWKYVTGLTGHNNGDNWQAGDDYFQQLDALGNGVQGFYPVPEPSTFALLGLGLVGLGVQRRRRRAAV